MRKSKYARYELDQSPFYCLKSKAKLAKLLRVSQIKLKLLTNTEHLYVESDIFDSERGKSRRFEKPRQYLKRVETRIEELLKRIKVPNYIHAAAKGRSYISNAKLLRSGTAWFDSAHQPLCYHRRHRSRNNQTPIPNYELLVVPSFSPLLHLFNLYILGFNNFLG